MREGYLAAGYALHAMANSSYIQVQVHHTAPKLS